MGRYYLEVVEAGERFSCGSRDGYKTLKEAEEEAKRHVYTTLPYNFVHILHHVGTAYLGGDGGAYLVEKE